MVTAVRKAFPVHHTDTVKEPWNAGAMLKAMGDAPGVAALKQMHAWMDPEGDPEAKGTYKLPHHMVDGDGNVGPANMKACSAAMGAINGARGGMDIPDADRKAVYRHIAAHMMDGDMEPPDMMDMNSLRGIERRVYPLVEVRVADDDGTEARITGHAAVFNQLSENLGGFREQIAPGAFRKTLQEADVRALFNHDANYVLGRTKSATLEMAEDLTGLAVTITPPDTTWARDLLTSMRRGDIDQMSFGFQTVRDRWVSGEDGETVRTLLEVKLFDVSPVTFPAYPQTDVAVRSALAKIGLGAETLGALLHIQTDTLSEADIAALRELIAEIERVLPAAPGQVAHPAEPLPQPGAPSVASGHPLEWYQRWLDFERLKVA